MTVKVKYKVTGVDIPYVDTFKGDGVAKLADGANVLDVINDPTVRNVATPSPPAIGDGSENVVFVFYGEDWQTIDEATIIRTGEVIADFSPDGFYFFYIKSHDGLADYYNNGEGKTAVMNIAYKKLPITNEKDDNLKYTLYKNNVNKFVFSDQSFSDFKETHNGTEINLPYKIPTDNDDDTFLIIIEPKDGYLIDDYKQLREVEKYGGVLFRQETNKEGILYFYIGYPQTTVEDYYKGIDLGITTKIDDRNPPPSELPEPSKGGVLANIYNVNIDEIRKFSGFFYGNPMEDSGNDLNPYFINLLEVPFKFGEYAIEGVKNVILGNKTLPDYKAPYYSVDVLTIEFGVYDIRSFNILYINNSRLELNLPFTNSTIELNVGLYVNKVISVYGYLDVYNGDITINIYDSEDNELLQSETLKIGRSVPFTTQNDVIGSIASGNGRVNRIYKPFILLTTPPNEEAMLKNDFYGLILQYGQLKDFKGYVEVDNIELQVSGLLDEIREIKTKLSQGVFIYE